MRDADAEREAEVVDRGASSHDVEQPKELMFASGYGVTVRTANGEQLELRAPDGRVCLRVTLTERGPAVEIETADLSILSHGAIRLGAQDLEIEATRSLAIKSGGDFRIESAGQLATTAASQKIEATRGEIHVKANDDVRVDGERVRLNAPEAPPLRRR